MEGVKEKEGLREFMENIRRISFVGRGHRRTRSGVSVPNAVGAGGARESTTGGNTPAISPPVKHKPNDFPPHATANGNGVPQHTDSSSLSSSYARHRRIALCLTVGLEGGDGADGAAAEVEGEEKKGVGGYSQITFNVRNA
jgi:hypothetical protein